MTFKPRMSYRTRLGTSILILAVTAALVAGFAVYTTSKSVIEHNAVQMREESLDRTATLLDLKLKNAFNAVNYMMLSTTYRQLIGFDGGNLSNASYFERQYALQSPLLQIKLFEPLIDNVYIWMDGKEYYSAYGPDLNDTPFLESSIYLEKQQNPSKIWFEAHTDELFEDGARVLSIWIDGDPTHRPGQVHIIVNIKESSMASLIEGRLVGKEKLILVSEQNEEVLQTNAVSSNILSALQGMPIGEEVSGRYESKAVKEELILYQQLDVAKSWTLVNIISKHELYNELSRVNWILLLIIVVIVVIVLGLTFWLSRLLYNPLHQLLSLIRSVENNDLNARFSSHRQDEISRVGYRFNSMMDQMIESRDKAKELEELKRVAEIKALQAQIDPHFLYNTLNTIYWKMNLKKQEDASRMVLSLSKLFQLGLNNGRDMTTLSLEIEHVNHYVELQQMSYSGKFSYKCSVDKDVNQEQSVVKVIIQPLVENAILHGFKNMDEDGELTLSINSNLSGELVITVEDNGEGMSIEQLNELRENIHLPEEERHNSHLKGYALYNVRKRLELYYGNKARIEIWSEMNKGTFFRIFLPIIHSTNNIIRSEERK